MFARFDKNPAMTLQDIKETKRYALRQGRTDGRMHGQRENSIPPTNKVCEGYNKLVRGPLGDATYQSSRPYGFRKENLFHLFPNIGLSK